MDPDHILWESFGSVYGITLVIHCWQDCPSFAQAYRTHIWICLRIGHSSNLEATDRLVSPSVLIVPIKILVGGIPTLLKNMTSSLGIEVCNIWNNNACSKPPTIIISYIKLSLPLCLAFRGRKAKSRKSVAIVPLRMGSYTLLVSPAFS